MLDTHRLLKESAQRAAVLIQRFSSLFLGSEPTIASFFVSWYSGSMLQKEKIRSNLLYRTESRAPQTVLPRPKQTALHLTICIQPHAALWDKSWQGN